MSIIAISGEVEKRKSGKNKNNFVVTKTWQMESLPLARSPGSKLMLTLNDQ